MTFRGIFTFCALLTLACMPLLLSARHIIGGEITYECLGAATGGNRYRFTMKIYRDCDPSNNGADYDFPAHMAIFRGTYTNNFPYETFQVNSPDIARLIPDTPACIAKVPFLCVQQGIYEFERILPVLANESYFIVYQRCCRNNSIVNIVNPEDVGATYMVELTPAAQKVCNNSPVYNEFPPIIICNNVPIVFDHSATDPDGDQLVYSFCSPLNGGGPLLDQFNINTCDGAQPIPPCKPPFDNVPFVVPTYSPGNPMGGNPQITINPVTGLITGTPTLLGRFVVAVCVQEFRNGQLLSTIKRDFQFNVADCQPQVVAGIGGGADTLIAVGQKYYLRSCGAKTLTLDNKSLDPKFIKSFEWNFNLKGTPFLDNVNWNPTIPFPDTGRYLGNLFLNPGLECADTAYITVDIFPKVTADFEYDYDTCVAGPVIFKDKSYSDGIVDRWSWQFGVPGGTSKIQDPTFAYPYPGNHPVRLRAIDKNNCFGSVVKTIKWYPVPPLIIIQPNSYLGCAPADILFTNLSTPIDSTYHIVWDFGDDTTTEDIISPEHRYENAGLYTVSVAITSPIGCFTTDTFPNLIKVEPSPTADFACDPDTLLSTFNRTVKFIDLSTGAKFWNWQFDRFGTTIQQNPTFTFPDTGLYKVTLIVTHPAGCKDSLSKYLDIVPEIRWYMPNAFTPNGDGSNDGFLGKGFLEGVTDFRMTIWNRWGELVFETSDPSEDWNGRVKNIGGMSPSGVYVYVVNFTGPRGQKFDFQGFATLVR